MPEYHYTFIAHSNADIDIGERYASEFERIGIPHYFDRGRILVGETWERTQEIHLNQATALVILASPEAMASQWVDIEVRTFMSLSFNKRNGSPIVIPVMIRPCELTPFVATFTRIDAYALPFLDVGARLSQALEIRAQQTSPASTTPAKVVETPPLGGQTLFISYSHSPTIWRARPTPLVGPIPSPARSGSGWAFRSAIPPTCSNCSPSSVSWATRRTRGWRARSPGC